MLDDLVSDLNGAKIFSTIDMREGYHQIELSPESRSITTFTTHVGLRRYKRLTMGISCAAELFHHLIAQVIDGISGVRNVADDIIVFGENQHDHDRSLRELFKRLADRGLTLRKEKCHFNQREVTFFGFRFSGKGLSPDPARIEAISKMDTPRDASKIRSLLGMTNYCARFIPHYADITEPLRRLTHKPNEENRTTWKWTSEQ